MTAHVPIPVNAVAVEARFADLCDHRAALYVEGVLDLHEAVDECYAYSVLSGLIDRVGQDSVQHLMAIAFGAPDLLPDIEQPDFEVGDIVRRWEMADSRDGWKYTGETPPPASVRNGPAPEPRRQSNRPAQSTIDAFLHLARHDPERLPGWLADHPQDAPELFKIWKAKKP